MPSSLQDKEMSFKRVDRKAYNPVDFYNEPKINEINLLK